MKLDIDSPNNPLIKETVTLQQKKGREERNLLLVEGLHPLEEALRSGLKLEKLFILESASLPQTLSDAMSDLPNSVLRVSERAMAKMATTDSPPSYLGIIHPTFQSLDDLFIHTPSCLLILDQLQDPGNMGTLVRSAKAFGIQGIILTQNTVDPFSPKVIRGSAGLVFSLPVIVSNHTLHTLLSQIQARQFLIYTTAGERGQGYGYRQADYQKPFALVLGSEGGGLADTWIYHAKHNFNQNTDAPSTIQCLSIPMVAGVESLNVAVSGSIILAEAAAQRAQSH